MHFVAQNIETLYSSTATQEYDDWDETVEYTLELDNDNLTNSSVVKYGNYYYRSLSDSNTGNNPVESLDIHWVKWGVDNRYAMIDLSSQSKTVVEDGDLVVVFKRGLIDTLGMGNIEAQSIKIEYLNADLSPYLKSSDNTPYVDEYSLNINDDVDDLWSYIYSTYTNELKRNIRIHTKAVGKYLRITFAQRTTLKRASCGFLIGGEATEMGNTMMGVDFGFKSFAKKDTDDFGTLKIVKRSIQDTVDFQTVIPRSLTMALKRKLKEIYNDIVLFVIDPADGSDYENLLTFGVIENASVTISEPSVSYIQWSVIEAV